ncbi:ester cyclase [Aliiroseovarius sp. KMU-50]|uniref:Ester cyclase n=1 Tax=Aliiroseovarius salicola TaxID=3009082 RepID=A0ABT4W3P8_9RHOB|nr:ester cyclase [Aliiroseovarius sp. KMU-50]MDA5095143.1 ester cyclase [Aliiroseovarius sp. KMU-50]
MTIATTARDFFEACETGQGWEACQQYCHDDASFACQADALADTLTLEAYANWMKGLLTPLPNGHYELKGFAADEERDTVLAFAVFHGTQTGEGGPVPPTGNTIAADYVYSMKFDGGKIRQMTKIWNDGISMRQLGWA